MVKYINHTFTNSGMILFCTHCYFYDCLVYYWSGWQCFGI